MHPARLTSPPRSVGPAARALTQALGFLPPVAPAVPSWVTAVQSDHEQHGQDKEKGDGDPASRRSLEEGRARHSMEDRGSMESRRSMGGGSSRRLGGSRRGGQSRRAGHPRGCRAQGLAAPCAARAELCSAKHSAVMRRPALLLGACQPLCSPALPGPGSAPTAGGTQAVPGQHQARGERVWGGSPGHGAAL